MPHSAVLICFNFAVGIVLFLTLRTAVALECNTGLYVKYCVISFADRISQDIEKNSRKHRRIPQNISCSGIDIPIGDRHK